jgi:hypothetical protein
VLLRKTRAKLDGLLEPKEFLTLKEALRRQRGIPLENLTYIPQLSMLLDHVRREKEEVSYISMACLKLLNKECSAVSK